MSRMQRLYQSTILAHNKNPKNFGVLDFFTHQAHGKNPLCGDDYMLYLLVDENNCISQISFVGKGCAISKAAASMMTEHVLGQSRENVLAKKDTFLKMLRDSFDDEDKMILGSLALFEGVKEFPVRVKCAALIWRALEHALSENKDIEVSTE